MPFREKIAWLNLGCTGLVFACYFAAVVDGVRAHVAATYFSGLFIIACIAITIIASIGGALTGIFSGRDANAPADERDRMIELRATATGYYVLLVGVIAAVSAMFWGATGWNLANLIALAIVAAELVRYAAVIRGYRQGF